jgi:hypothetical protein
MRGKGRVPREPKHAEQGETELKVARSNSIQSMELFERGVICLKMQGREWGLNFSRCGEEFGEKGMQSEDLNR